MKKLCNLLIVIAMLTMLCSCNGNSTSQHESSEKTSDTFASSISPEVFKSMSDFSKSKMAEQNLYCAVPATTLKGLQLEQVEVLDDFYVALIYRSENNSAKNFTSIDEIDQASRAEYYVFRYEDAQGALEKFINNGFTLVGDEETGVYCYSDLSQETGDVISYSFVYIEGNCLIQVNLPAIADAKDMLPFIKTDVLECSSREAIETVDQMKRATDTVDGINSVETVLEESDPTETTPGEAYSDITDPADHSATDPLDSTPEEPDPGQEESDPADSQLQKSSE